MTVPLKLVEQDPSIKHLLSRMPKEVADSFTEKQLTHLMIAIGARAWGRHSIDIRGTLSIPLYRWRLYYVLLFGKNHRNLSRREHELTLLTLTCMVAIGLSVCALLGILVLYLVKSALGIDIIPGYSFGVWDWIKEIFAN